MGWEARDEKRRVKVNVKLFNVEYRERPVCQGFPSHFEYPKAGLSGFSFPFWVPEGRFVRVFLPIISTRRPVCQGFPSHYECPKAGLSGFPSGLKLVYDAIHFKFRFQNRYRISYFTFLKDTTSAACRPFRAPCNSQTTTQTQDCNLSCSVGS